MKDDYEPGVLDKIPLKETNIIMMRYSNKIFMEKIIKQNDFPKNIYIDNDYGFIGKYAEFISFLNNKS